MLAEGIKFVMQAGPLHVLPTPEIEAALGRHGAASPGPKAA